VLFSRSSGGSPFSWEVTVEVWSGADLTPAEWARTHDGCAAMCALSSVQIHGQPFVKAVRSDTGAHRFYSVRGSELVVISYILGPGNERPLNVTEEILEQIVESIRFV
jgi:hypothetical protein